MQPLPIAEEQIWLLDALSQLIRDHGHAPFTGAPIPTPSFKYLPDPIEPDLRSVHALCRRLMRYAELGHCTVSLVGRGQAAQGPVAGGRGGMWLSRRDADHFEIGLEPQRIDDVDDLLAQTARTVARAWRVYHGLEDADPYNEARLVDVTAIYLGFGVFTLNGALDTRTPADAGMVGGWWGAAAPSGYLGPQGAAWLLGAQLIVRPTDEEALEGVRRTLAPPQRACLDASMMAHGRQVEGVRSTLALPDPSTWGPPRALAPLVTPLSESPLGDPEVSWDQPPEPPRAAPIPEAHGEGGHGEEAHSEEAHSVFRVMHSGLPERLWVQVILLALATALAIRVAGRLGGLIALICASSVVMAVLRNRRLETCSYCNHKLSRDTSECPGCGGVIRGRIQRRGPHDPMLDALHTRKKRTGGKDHDEKV